jgi:hypothetical protein
MKTKLFGDNARGNFNPVCISERKTIIDMWNAGKQINDIAFALQRHNTTIGRVITEYIQFNRLNK